MRTGEIYEAENRISIKYNIHASHMRFMCSALYRVIKDRGYQDVVLDFSPCSKVFSSFILPLLPIITKYQKENVDFDLLLPIDEPLRSLFLNTNWAHHIAPKKFKESDFAARDFNHVPAIRYQDVGTMAKGIEKILNVISGVIEGIDRQNLKALHWSLNEVADNVLNHAHSEVGGFIQATTYKAKKEVEFIVADAGIGIPQSMGEKDHVRALQHVLSEGVTRDKTKNQGNGLYGSYRAAVLSQGEFEIHSQTGHLLAKGIDDINLRVEKIPYMGTSVLCKIRCDDPNLLNKALRFQGKPHDPPFDFIEYKYGTEDDNKMIFFIKDEYAATSSREGGAYIRNKLETLLKDGKSIVVDFSDVSLISSSFADEVFGRLFVNLGPVAFANRIHLRKIDGTLQGLIDRAIKQRFHTGNGDEEG